jgi:YesN/AraC family two-component response regulator
MAGTRVLLVDDEALVRQILKQVLAGYPEVELVGEAESGEEAITAVDRLQPDIVVMDIRMPALDGMAAARKIRLKYPDIKIIGLSDSVWIQCKRSRVTRNHHHHQHDGFLILT